MSAQEATSGIVFKEIDGEDRLFRTITTHENGVITNTEIQEVISESLYNTRLSETPDLVSEDDDGFFYQTVRDGGTDTIYADLGLREAFEEQNSLGVVSLTNDLNAASVDALTDQFSEDKQESKDYFWNTQLSGNDNVAVSSDSEVLTTSDPDFTLESFEIAGERQTTYDNLYYPYDIATSNQDRIVFKMFYQSGRSLNFDLSNSEGSIFEFGNRSRTTIEGSVTLPIQGGIQDNNQVDFNGATLNPVQGALASVALNPLQAISQVGSILNMNPDQIRGALGTDMASNTINALRVFLAQSAVGGSGLIPRTTGAILNPNLELLLKAPTLRSFNFAFKMSARSSTEAQQIRKIIRFFKQGMSVKRSPSSLFVVSPNMFSIQYLAGTEGNLLTDHPSIGKIKDCALTALNTNYTPDGTYMTFDDAERTMTSYTINMQFTELDPLTETDYIETAANEDSIGY